MTAIDYFEALGQSVRTAWSAHGFSSEALPDLAVEALSTSRPSDHVSIDDLVDWIAEAPALPEQPNLTTPFGQPPLTVFHDEHFYIEALFWTTATTAIHQHAFSGAFHVLAGSSLQTRYDFQLHERPCEALLLGDLTLRDVKVLSHGDTAPIIGGRSLIHAVFHLDTPSVTVVVRTHHDAGCRPQYSYLRPHVAYDPRFQDPLTVRRVQMLGLLQRLGSPRYASFAATALASADIWGTFRILQCVYQHASFMRVSFEDLLTLAERRHGASVRALEAAIREEARIARLQARRQKIFDREHRFFLALVLNLPDRSAIIRAVQAAYPAADPESLLSRWASECRLSGIWDPSMTVALATADR